MTVTCARIAAGGPPCTLSRSAGAILGPARPLRVRPIGSTCAKGSQSWRYESCFKSYGEAMEVVDRIPDATPVTVRQTARPRVEPWEGRLPFAAAPRRCGPAWPCSRGRRPSTSSRRWSGYRPLRRLRPGHRGHPQLHRNGCDPQLDLPLPRRRHPNILEFEGDFPDATVVKLEQNYRSTQTILNASNAVIANNRSRKEKSALDRARRGRPGARPGARGRARGGAVRGLGDRAARRRGGVARRDRGLLPDQRPEPRARGQAGALRRSATR